MCKIALLSGKIIEPSSPECYNSPATLKREIMMKEFEYHISSQITDAGGNIKVINNSDIRTLVNLSEVASTAIADVGISCNADLEKAEQVILTLTGTESRSRSRRLWCIRSSKRQSTRVHYRRKQLCGNCSRRLPALSIWIIIVSVIIVSKKETGYGLQI